ncbi:MAG: hypothetical protein ACTSRA_20720, partial [Promethearchaeota archaeon]
VISISGAGCVLSVDAVARTGIQIPPLSEKIRCELEGIFPSWFNFSNPIDLWAAIENVGSKAAFNKAIESVIKDDFNAVIVINLAMPESLMDWDFISDLRAKHEDKPIILVLLGGHPDIEKEWLDRCIVLKIPVYRSPLTAIKVLNRAWSLSRWYFEDFHEESIGTN